MRLLAAAVLGLTVTTLFGAPATNLLTHQDADGEIAGWKSFHEQPNTKTSDGWKLGNDGVLTCRGEPKGYLVTEQTYQDFTLSFEWRWPPGGKAGNGRNFARAQTAPKHEAPETNRRRVNCILRSSMCFGSSISNATLL